MFTLLIEFNGYMADMPETIEYEKYKDANVEAEKRLKLVGVVMVKITDMNSGEILLYKDKNEPKQNWIISMDVCKYCEKDGLHWQYGNDGWWHQYEKDGLPHNCKK
jgi:hypothetical protein